MTYLLTVTRNEPNPKYQPDSYRSNEAISVTTQVLTMEVTPEQFDRIRNAALEVCK